MTDIENPNPNEATATEQQPDRLDSLSRAVGALDKRLRKLDQLEALIESKVSERLASIQPAKAEPEATAVDKDEPWKRQIADARNATRKLEEKLAAKDREAREHAGYAKLREALTPHVRPEALEVAAKHIFKAEQLVSVDEHGIYWGAEKDSFEDGLTSWLASKDAQLFKPAPQGAKGPAIKPGLPARASLNGLSKEEKIAAWEQSFKAGLLG